MTPQRSKDMTNAEIKSVIKQTVLAFAIVGSVWVFLIMLKAI